MKSYLIYTLGVVSGFVISYIIYKLRPIEKQLTEQEIDTYNNLNPKKYTLDRLKDKDDGGEGIYI